MIAIVTVGRLVLHERCGTTAIEEVDDDAAFSTAIGRRQFSVEVLEQVHFLAIVHSWSEDPRYGVVVGLGVVADDRRVDEEGQEEFLVLLRVFLQQGAGVVVAYGHIRRTPICCYEAEAYYA